ncbi:DUF2860 family protein [Vibrio sp. NH-UV-68]|uniref:DUF2860 domain-containing protein n=1 Tax=unclassified Vibrio TaxID=2614977 RepID=UPI0036F38E55
MTTKTMTFALALMCATPAIAQLSDTGGFSGEVSLSAGYISSSSNFNTDANATINDNNQQATSEHRFIPLPLGNIAFTFGQGLDKQIYAGTSREDIAIGTLALEIGFKQKLASGTVIDVALLPTIMSGETWADPFVEGSARTITDESGNAYRLKLSNIAGSGFTLDTAMATQEIDNERSGLDSGYTANLLSRNADKLYAKGSFRLFINRGTFLIPSVSYIKSDADGEANSFTSWKGELSLFQRFGRHQLALTAGYTERSYEASHPVYSMTRDDNDLSLFAAYEYQQLFGWRNLSWISFAGYGQTDSTIQFYDSEQMIVSTGVSLKF